MAQATFSVRMDKALKDNFSDICNSIGMNMSTAINIFANAVVDSKKNPFEVKVPSSYTQEFKNTITSMRETAKKNNLDKLTLDDINDIINKTKKQRKRK